MKDQEFQKDFMKRVLKNNMTLELKQRFNQNILSLGRFK